MTVQQEATTILKDVGKELASIIIPPKKDVEQSEYIVMHYCEKCKKLHRAS